MTKVEKIYGGLLGAAVGDCIGAATETRSIQMIYEKWGGWVTDFVEIPDDTFMAGKPTGRATDDFGLAYYTAKAIVKHGGAINDEVAKEALLTWSETSYYDQAGPTTRAAVARMRGEDVPVTGVVTACDNSKASNGSAMKIGPVGLVSGGDIDKAIEDTIVICMPTHGNNVALSAAAAVSAGIAAALKDGATLDDVIKAGIYGAKKGYEIGSKVGKPVATPSVEKRIELAVEIGKKYKGDVYAAMQEISDIIGTGLAAYEAVPAAFGLMVAADGDPVQAVLGGVNAGSDTDTVATIIGSMVGTLHGYKAYPQKWVDKIEQENNFHLESLAQELAAL